MQIWSMEKKQKLCIKLTETTECISTFLPFGIFIYGTDIYECV